MSLRSRALLAVLVLGVAVHSALPLAQPGQARLDFSTYFGGSGDDAITAVRADAAGNIYVAGSTRSADLFAGGAWLAPPPLPNQQVGFLAKIRADRSLAYTTYLERPVKALAVDAFGNAIVADNLPGSGGRFSGPLGDVMVTKIDATGTTVLYSTRLAGGSNETVAAIAVDASGSVVVTGQTVSANFPLVNALQPVRSSSSVAAGDAFVTKLDPQGQIVFSTAWGGIGTDAGSAVAIDGNSDIVVAGTTTSPDFLTTAGSLQRNLRNNGCRPGAICTDAFVVRLSSDGQVVRYSTLYGGSAHETVTALVLDRFGSPHLTGETGSTDLPLHNAFQTACNSARVDLYGCSSYVARLSPDGTVLRYATYFGSMSYYVGSLGLSIADLAVDAEGNLVVAGTTEGNDLPVPGAFQSVNGGGPLFKSSDDGATWTPSGSGLAGTGVWALDSAGRQSLYARPLGGALYRSDDRGSTWFVPRQGGPEPGMVAVDPLSPSTLYAGSTNGLLKSTDGGRRWSTTSSFNEQLTVVRVAPSAPSNVYALSNRGVHHSPNAGLTWSLILDMPFTTGKPYVQDVAVDPLDAGAIYALMSDSSLMRRQGQLWETVSTMQCPANQLVFEEVLPRAIYARACGKVWKSVDHARTWREIGFSSRTAAWMFLDAARPNIIYVASAQNGVYRSRDAGETWQLIREPLDQDVRTVMVDPAEPRTVYIGATTALNAFVTRVNPSGAVTFGSYLGGLSAAGHAVAIGPNGTIIVAGRAGREFPMVQPIQGRVGNGDGFIARITDR
jgi:photosystem II stability/assembly factor-like uncharacterized protein